MTSAIDFHNGPSLFESRFNHHLDVPVSADSSLSASTKPTKVAAEPHLVAHDLIKKALVQHVSDIDHAACDAGDEDSFFVCDLGEIYRSFKTWMDLLPQVHPYYAVKCNPNVEVIKLLSSLGANFDCASKTEIDTILGLGIDASRIVYANPCKTSSFIRHAANVNVNLTTVDNTHELVKLAKYHPGCGILIRIITNDEGAQCRLSTKFGCTLDTAVNDLLPLAQELGLSVQGVAFHVGSGAKEFSSIRTAISDARTVFDKGMMYGFDMKILDIGGGFEHDTFSESSRTVRDSLDHFFPADYVSKNQIRFFAEPGRFMVSNAFTLATHVIARREIPPTVNIKTKAMVYINDGVYGNLNCILFDHQHPVPKVLKHRNKFYYDETNPVQQDKLLIENDVKEKGKLQFSIWGPTCDGLDCVSNEALLNFDVEVGDWLYFSNLGAYTSTSTTSFNGFKGNAHVIYVNSQEETF